MGAQKRLKFLFSFIFLGTRSVWYCNSVELSSASNAEIPFEQMRYEKAEMACNKVPPIKSDKAIFLLNNENNTRYQTGGKNHDNIAQELYNDNPKYEVTTAIVDQLKDVELESGALPKIIWMLWDKGWDQANSDHRLSKISWAVTNPEFKILGLNMEEAEYLIERPKYFADEFWQGTTVQTKSDIIRIMLLSKYGGVWADASTFCRNPLRSWVDLEKNQDMVSFIRTDYANLEEENKDMGGKGINPWFTSWFIVAWPNSHIIQKIREVIIDPNEQWRFSSEYFWLHRILSELYAKDSAIKEIVSPWSSADGPHCFIPGEISIQNIYKKCNKANWLGMIKNEISNGSASSANGGNFGIGAKTNSKINNAMDLKSPMGKDLTKDHLLEPNVERIFTLRHYMYINPYNLTEQIPPVIRNYHRRFYQNNEIVYHHSVVSIMNSLYQYDRKLFRLLNENIDKRYISTLFSDIAKLIILYTHGGVYHDLELVSSIEIIPFLRKKYVEGYSLIAHKDQTFSTAYIISLRPKSDIIHKTLQDIKVKLINAQEHRFTGKITAYMIMPGTYIHNANKHHYLTTIDPIFAEKIAILDFVKEGYLFFDRQIQDEWINYLKTFGPIYCSYFNENKTYCDQLDDTILIVHQAIEKEVAIFEKEEEEEEGGGGVKPLKFIHITKTAGTSIEKIGNEINLKWGMNHIEYGFHHEPFWWKSKSLKDKYNWFTVVRNPYDRILSEYYCKWGYGATGTNNGMRVIHSKDYFNSFLIEAIEKVRYEDSEWGFHYTPQYKYIDNRYNIHILRFENLESDFNALMKEYNLNVTLSQEVNKAVNKTFEVKDFSNELITLINNVYHNDFEIFGYEKIHPVSKF